MKPSGDAAGASTDEPGAADASASSPRNKPAPRVMNKQTADRLPRVLQSRLINRPFSSISCLTGPNLRSKLRVGDLSASSAGTDETEWLAAGKGRTEWARSREKSRIQDTMLRAALIEACQSSAGDSPDAGFFPASQFCFYCHSASESLARYARDNRRLTSTGDLRRTTPWL
jgi:hypothetical protein